jgi:hypothetical protein
MAHPRNRRLIPAVEPFESRELLSGIISVLATQGQPVYHPRRMAGGASIETSQVTGSLVSPLFPPPIGPGPGDPTPRELAREQFKAYFSGPAYAAPPRFTSQSEVLFYRGLGGSTQFQHGDFQMIINMPRDPTAPILGLAYLQDRNINSAGALGLDLRFDPASLDSRGRPTRGTFTADPSIYSGLDYAFTASGTVTIKYGKGAATVRFQGLLYNSGVTDPLRNMDLQARGGRLVARSS